MSFLDPAHLSFTVAPSLLNDHGVFLSLVAQLPTSLTSLTSATFDPGLPFRGHIFLSASS